MNKGFTLIELVIVTAIISILAAVMLTNYGAGSRGFREQRSAQVVAQALRSAQVKALGSEVINCTDPPCKYGVEIRVGSPDIIIYGDGINGFASNNSYQSSGPTSELIEIFQLEDGIVVTSVSPGGVPLDILFEPPHQEITFRPSGGGATEAVITITGGKTITINKGGSIDIN